MEMLMTISFFTLIIVVIGLLLMHPMKVIQIVVPGIVVAASALLFVLGWEWEKRGNADLHVADSERREIGRALSEFGNIVECLGFLGALVGLALFGALWYLSAYKQQISRLEAEVDRLRQSLMAMRRSEKES